MNPVAKILSGIIITINKIIDSLDRQVVDTIRRGYLFLIFLLCLAAIYIGYSMGRESATIKSPPIAGEVKDVFALDINKEKEEGNFETMLKSKAIEEFKYSETIKRKFPSRENLEQESEPGIIDNKLEGKRFPDLRLKSMDGPLDSTNSQMKKNSSSITPLKRKDSDFHQQPLNRDRSSTGKESRLIDKPGTMHRGPVSSKRSTMENRRGKSSKSLNPIKNDNILLEK